MESVIAVYEKGVLRPTKPLALAEHTRVRVQIVEEVAEAEAQYPLLALANLGESPETDVSERAEAILAAEARARSGWNVSDADDR
jgi:predicted DNA-binding antitoxin AbrB/MazE fold protein